MAAETRRPLPDDAARRRAATDFDTNLVVLAGAGTGKTSLLVERALNAIGSGVARIEEIAAITFTEKAAGEMRERLTLGLDHLRALARGERDGREGAHEADRAFRHLSENAAIGREAVARRALEALEGLDHGTVLTIHAFCADLLRRHPVEAGVDPDFAVDAGESLATLAHEAWETFVHRELGPDAPRAEDWNRVLSRFSLSAIGELAQRLADFDVPLALLAPRTDARAALEPEARRILGDIEQGLDRSWLTSLGETCFSKTRDLLHGWLAGRPLAPDADFRRRLENGFPDPPTRLNALDRQWVKRVSHEARHLCRGILSADDEAIGRLLSLVEPYAREFRESYLRRGLVSFDGLLALTRELLRGSPEVRRAAKRRFRLLFVDEFQDTDPLQYEIVLFLGERPDDDAPDAFAARLVPGRLFVVGDAKQSIYRFRGADYAASSLAVRRIVAEGGVRLDLVGNFRSVPGILEPVNALFAAAEPGGSWRASAHQPDYVPIEPVRPSTAATPAVELWSVELEDNSRAEDRREAEGRLVAEAIERWVGEEGREYRSITLLLRAFSEIARYLRPLRERGIPFVVDGGREFLRRPEVAQLLATLRALAQPADEAALLAFLRSPAGGVSDLDLARYAEAGGRFGWTEWRVPDDLPDIARAFTTLRSLAEDLGRLPFDTFVRRVIERTQMLPLSAAAFEGAQRVANLTKLATAAAELVQAGSLSLEELIEALEEGRLEDLKTDRPLADDAAQAVRITSIHRMKGLENEIVILADLARQPRRGDFNPVPAHLVSFPDGGRALAIEVEGVKNLARVWRDLDHERHEEAEELRVLYVALTRARERLVLVAGAETNTSPWLEALAPWGFAPKARPGADEPLAGGRVRHRVLRPPARKQPAGLAEDAAATAAVARYDEAVLRLRDASRPPLAAPSALEEHAGPAWRPRAVAPAARDLGQAVGAAAHRALERWDGASPTTLTHALRHVLDETARARGIDRDALERAASEVMEPFVATGLAARWGALERIDREMPVLVELDGRSYDGSLDLLYRDASGELVVCDYKTDRETDAEALVRTYGSQLGVYAEAVQLALGLARRPRAELWMLRTGEVIEIGDAPPPAAPPQQLKLF